MKKLILFMALFAVVGIASANMLINGDFEDPAGSGWSQWWGGNSNKYVPDPVEPDNCSGVWWSDDGIFQGVAIGPGTYTVRLHFLESFFSPLIPASSCPGVGCRVFDVTCNGVMLLEDFDIVQAAPGAFQPVVREFHGLCPNGQGKLLLSFSPKANYAAIRAIEVIDEAK